MERDEPNNNAVMDLPFPSFMIMGLLAWQILIKTNSFRL
jgi:hypothetical protein